MARSDAHRSPTALATTLHQDARFLRALAKSLLHDDAAADDVVQEALVTALRRPPPTDLSRRADLSLRGWLAGIVRHLSFRRRRSEQRRVLHEAAAASVVVLEGAESPAAIVARGELLQLLVNAVMELPAAQRDTVLLRYFEGLSAAEIARRRGLPDATVRSHLKRALDALRARLDARSIGGRAAWIALLAPWAGDAAAPIGATAGGGSGSASSAASAAGKAASGGAGLKLVGACAAVAVAAALALRDEWGERPRVTPSDSARFAADAVPDASSPTEAGNSVALVEHAAPPIDHAAAAAALAAERALEQLRRAPLPAVPLARVMGRANRPDGAPLSTIQATLRRLDPLQQRTGETRTAECTADGAFRIDALDHGALWRLELDDGPWHVERLLALLPGSNDFGTFELAPRAPAPFAEWSRRRVAGRVIDELGAPIERAVLHAVAGDRTVALRLSDREGRFAFDAPLAPFRLWCAAFGFEPASNTRDFELQPEPPRAPLQLVLKRAPPFRIELRDLETKRPPPGAQALLLESASASDSDRRSLVAWGELDQALRVRRRGDEGLFDVALWRTRPDVVAGFAPGFAARGERQLSSLPPRTDSSLPASRVDLPRAEMIAVRVIGADGVPIHEATVVALRGSSSFDGGSDGAAADSSLGPTDDEVESYFLPPITSVLPRGALAYATTDRDGLARLFGVAGKSDRLEVRVDGRWPWRVDLRADARARRSPESRLVEVVLEAPAALTGQVVDATRSGSRGTSVRLLCLAGAGHGLVAFTRCDGASSFRFDGLPPGSYDVEVATRHEPFVVEQAPPHVLAAGASVAVVLAGGAAASGRVEGRLRIGAVGGAGLVARLERVVRDDRERSLARSGRDRFAGIDAPRRVRLGSEGEFLFDELPTPSDWRLSVEDAGALPGTFLRGVVEETIHLDEGGSTWREFAWPAAVSVGAVVDAMSGEALAGVEVQWRGSGTATSGPSFDSWQTALTDVAGRFESPPLLKGGWTVSVVAPGYWPFEQAIGDARAPLAIALERGGWARAVVAPVEGERPIALRVTWRSQSASRDSSWQEEALVEAASACWLLLGDRAALSESRERLRSAGSLRAEIVALDRDGRELTRYARTVPVTADSVVQLSLGE